MKFLRISVSPILFLALSLALGIYFAVEGVHAQSRPTRRETITQHFYLGSCPDDVEGDSPKNGWSVYYDNENDEGTATCSYTVYDAQN